MRWNKMNTKNKQMLQQWWMKGKLTQQTESEQRHFWIPTSAWLIENNYCVLDRLEDVLDNTGNIANIL